MNLIKHTVIISISYIILLLLFAFSPEWVHIGIYFTGLIGYAVVIYIGTKITVLKLWK